MLARDQTKRYFRLTVELTASLEMRRHGVPSAPETDSKYLVQPAGRAMKLGEQTRISPVCYSQTTGKDKREAIAWRQNIPGRTNVGSSGDRKAIVVETYAGNRINKRDAKARVNARMMAGGFRKKIRGPSLVPACAGATGRLSAPVSASCAVPL